MNISVYCTYMCSYDGILSPCLAKGNINVWTKLLYFYSGDSILLNCSKVSPPPTPGNRGYPPTKIGLKIKILAPKQKSPNDNMLQQVLEHRIEHEKRNGRDPEKVK
jgi:hypothetical protein